MIQLQLDRRDNVGSEHDIYEKEGGGEKSHEKSDGQGRGQEAADGGADDGRREGRPAEGGN